MKRSHTAPEIASLIKGCTRVLVVSHYNPDADAYGSSCGLTLALQSIGITTICLNESGIQRKYSTIPGVTEVQDTFPAGEWDLLIACDCGDMKRFGDRLIEQLRSFPKIVNIDHHISNDRFGHYNLVVDTASSTSEIILSLIKEMSIPVTSQIAHALFAGLSADTGSFRYSNTSAQVFDAAAELVRAGADPYAIAQSLYSRNSLSSTMLQSEALASLKTYSQGRLALVVVREEMYKKFGATQEDTDSLVDKVRDIDGVVVGVFIREDQGVWKVSLRSRDPNVNVSDVASAFGGGGHVMAAAFRWKKEYAELEPLLLSAIERALGA